MWEQPTLFDIPSNNEVALAEETGDEDDDDDPIGPIFMAGSACPPCNLGSHSGCFHSLIEEGNEYCCCPESSVTANNSEAGESGKSSIARFKEASEVTDVQSTGRKRAAQAYPITEGMICEWSKLKRNGGGPRPIIGCAGNPATDIHHGPDKNTLNNTPENVHRICAHCHNRWHSANDAFYGTRPPGSEPFIPLDGHNWGGHDAETPATDEDIIASELYWATPKSKRPEYETLIGERK